MFVIGLMSGTSVDGVNAALVEVSESSTSSSGIEFKLLGSQETPIDAETKARILAGMSPTSSTVALVCQLNFEVGELFAKATDELLVRLEDKLSGVPRTKVLVASHGQTLYHIPRLDSSRGWLTPSTLQVGEPCVIAERTGCNVVADFRVRDMACGGCGAPLIPVADSLFFGHLSGFTVAQNLGGIGNCTLLAEGGEILVAFDTGPGNMIMDALCRRHFGVPYDDGGNLARKGSVVESLLAATLALPFFHEPPPRATGHETFGSHFLDWWETQSIGFGGRGGGVSEEGETEGEKTSKGGVNPHDLLATALELTVLSTVDAYAQFLVPFVNERSAAGASLPTRVLVSGGGSKNTLLLERLEAAVSSRLGWSLGTTDEFGVPSSDKEAMGFALLGYASVTQRAGNSPMATGAKRPAVLGKFVPGVDSSVTFSGFT